MAADTFVGQGPAFQDMMDHRQINSKWRICRSHLRSLGHIKRLSPQIDQEMTKLGQPNENLSLSASSMQSLPLS